MENSIPLVEVLVDALGDCNRYSDPSSLSYKLRSPLLLQSFAVPGKHVVTEEGLRVFPSSVSGYKAAVFDMQLKITGNSRARLKPTDTLVNLLGVYRIKDSADQVVQFLRVALDDNTISKDTQLSRFIEDPNAGPK